MIFDLLKIYSHIGDKAVVLVTHNPEVEKIADHVIKLRDGMIIADERPAKMTDKKAV